MFRHHCPDRRAVGSGNGPRAVPWPPCVAARHILEANAEPGSLQITAEERSRLGGRPALALRARYTKAGQPVQVRGFFSFSSGKPVYLFLIGTTNDAVDWAGHIADRMQLFK